MPRARPRASVHRLLDGLLDELGVLSGDAFFCVMQVVGQRAGRQADGGEVLAEAVVQVLSDALLLVLAHRHEIGLELAALLQRLECVRRPPPGGCARPSTA
jgi:hypothetical protein